jgi:3-hydroxyisobutyrate dehydrogenase-like beta-hydroxyacid dehydrogenase
LVAVVSEERPTVAFLGLGRMGSRIARNIAQAGFPIVLFNRTPSAASELAAEVGGTVAATAAEAAAAATVTLSSLADDAAVRAVYEGPDGLIAGLRPGSVVVDMSTIDPVTVADIAAQVAATGASFVDAPVSGSTASVETKVLLIMAGGSEADVEHVRPILEATSSSIVRVGDVGAGAAIKLAVNAIIFGLDISVAEALVLAERAGIDRTVAYDVIAGSAVGAPMVQYRRAQFEQPGELPASFTIELAIKDLRLILELAERSGAPMPQTERNLEVMSDAVAHGRGDEDIAAVAEHFRHDRGA